MSAEVDETVDKSMTNTVRDLYRDAMLNRYAYYGWGPRMNDASTPGMLVGPDEDAFGSVDLNGGTAERIKAKLLVLLGRSHCWMRQGPEAAAALLRELWA